jgi:hypothetical protein
MTPPGTVRRGIAIDYTPCVSIVDRKMGPSKASPGPHEPPRIRPSTGETH